MGCLRRDQTRTETHGNVTGWGPGDYRLRFNHDVPGLRATVDVLEGCRRQRLRRRACRGSRDESAGVKLRHVAVAGCLDVVSELLVHLHHDLAMFLLRADGFPASIRRVRHQNGQGVDGRFERGHRRGSAKRAPL